MCKGSRSMAKRRLDTLLTERGLFPSRSRAAASVMAGEVRVGQGRSFVEHPNHLAERGKPVQAVEAVLDVFLGKLPLPMMALAAVGLVSRGKSAVLPWIARIRSARRAHTCLDRPSRRPPGRAESAADRWRARLLDGPLPPERKPVGSDALPPERKPV